MRRTRRSARRGFSLVEVLVAMGVMAILLLGLGATTLGSVRVTELVQERRIAMNQAQSVLTRLLADPQLQETFADAATGSPTKLTYDLATDLGEVAPAELRGWSGTLEIRSYQLDQPVGGPPTAWRDFVGVAPFAWSEGHVYELVVKVTWTPAIYTRTKQSGSLDVTTRSYYYPPPPWSP